MNINVLTYNMSWATQQNLTMGSEQDFVEECQKKYKRGGKQCTENAIKKIGRLPKLHLMGIQEVNSNIETKIKNVQSSLNKKERGTIGRSTISLMWDSSIFGKKIEKCVFNLVDSSDDRPCLIIMTKIKDTIFLLINLHSPWEVHKLSSSLSKNIRNKCNQNIQEAFKNTNAKIIVTGDFNDSKSIINKSSPLTFKIKRKKITLKHNKTKRQLKKSLKSCCWHEVGHKWGHFKDTGDYILTNNKVSQLTMEIPKIFAMSKRPDSLFSDHKPVLSKIRV